MARKKNDVETAVPPPEPPQPEPEQQHEPQPQPELSLSEQLAHVEAALTAADQHIAQWHAHVELLEEQRREIRARLAPKMNIGLAEANAAFFKQQSKTPAQARRDLNRRRR